MIEIIAGLCLYVFMTYVMFCICDCCDMSLDSSIIVGIAWPISIPAVIILWSVEFYLSVKH